MALNPSLIGDAGDHLRIHQAEVEKFKQHYEYVHLIAWHDTIDSQMISWCMDQYGFDHTAKRWGTQTRVGIGFRDRDDFLRFKLRWL